MLKLMDGCCKCVVGQKNVSTSAHRTFSLDDTQANCNSHTPRNMNRQSLKQVLEKRVEEGRLLYTREPETSVVTRTKGQDLQAYCGHLGQTTTGLPAPSLSQIITSSSKTRENDLVCCLRCSFLPVAWHRHKLYTLALFFLCTGSSPQA